MNKTLFIWSRRGALGEELERANAIYKKDRQAAYDIHKRRRTWADWLQFKAAGGDDEALKNYASGMHSRSEKRPNIRMAIKAQKDGSRKGVSPGLKPTA